jgi:hypothetical protein
MARRLSRPWERGWINERVGFFAMFFKNLGSTVINLDGRVILLENPTPEGLAALTAFIREKKKPETATTRIMRELAARPSIPVEVMQAMGAAAVKCDHEEAMRERFTPPKPPMSAFFDREVLAMLLSLLAGAKQPDLTIEECGKIINKVGLEIVMAKLGLAMGGDSEKKDPALLAWLAGTTIGTGPPTPENSANPEPAGTP